jgi:type I restriction enzyme R subunit
MGPSEPQRAWTPQCYDPLEQHTVVWRKLPHWSQSGALTFITWRTWDSMPAAVVRAWLAERDDWLRRQGVDPSQPDWECLLRDWPVAQRQAFRRFVSDRWGQHLDELHGSCPLRRPEFAAIVAESLRHFDGDRYVLSDFVVMPNHVHLLAAFPTEESLLAQCESWKHYTGRKFNRALGRFGRFWEQDAFDHLVRSPEEFESLRRYLVQNPITARLSRGEYLHYSCCTPHAPP